MYHIIYKITNLKNNKIYVGYHGTENLSDSYMGSGKAIKLAIRKTGIENFAKEILYVYPTKEEAIAKEIEIVDEAFIARKDTYNIKLGGTGGWEHTWNDPKRIEGIKKSFETGRNKGWPLSIEARQKLGKSSFKGKHHSLETKKKISDSKKMSEADSARRLKEYQSIDKSWGWITKLAKSWGITNTQVKRYIKSMGI